MQRCKTKLCKVGGEEGNGVKFVLRGINRVFIIVIIISSLSRRWIHARVISICTAAASSHKLRQGDETDGVRQQQRGGPQHSVRQRRKKWMHRLMRTIMESAEEERRGRGPRNRRPVRYSGLGKDSVAVLGIFLLLLRVPTQRPSGSCYCIMAHAAVCRRRPLHAN